LSLKTTTPRLRSPVKARRRPMPTEVANEMFGGRRWMSPPRTPVSERRRKIQPSTKIAARAWE
jgi:hypothetical protein